MKINKDTINPETITKPIQLLSAWLIGLLLLVSTLLTAAGLLNTPSWLPPFLAISAVSIIPIFLVLIFLLQTKYRPEMQEDSYYSMYLNTETNQYESSAETNDNNIAIQEIAKISKDVKEQLKTVHNLISNVGNNNKDSVENAIDNSKEKLAHLEKRIDLYSVEMYINRYLPKYSQIVDIVKLLGIVKFHEFGSKKSPPELVISFGEDIPIDIISDLVIPISNITNGYIKLSTTAKNVIIIGSRRTYDTKIKIDQKLIEHISSSNEIQNIKDLYKLLDMQE